MIFFQIQNEKTVLVFELTGEQSLDSNIKKWLRKRNGAVLFRSPLVCEYTINHRESVLSREEIPDLRGLQHGFILYGVLNYGRLMIDHFLTNGSFFYTNLMGMYS